MGLFCTLSGLLLSVFLFYCCHFLALFFDFSAKKKLLLAGGEDPAVVGSLRFCGFVSDDLADDANGDGGRGALDGG